MTQVPTLVVGLGGLGSRIVEQVYERLERGAGQSRRVAWHVMDTNSLDLDDLRFLKHRADQFTQLGSGALHVVGQYQRAFPESERWFPYGRLLNPKSTLEGAGQIRAVSRLTFMALMQRPELLHRLDGAIAQLLELHADGGLQYNPRVILVTSLAGGTGAGAFIQVALYLRQLIARMAVNLPPESVTVRGFFMLPDVLVSNNVLPQDQWVNVRSNAMACLRELESIRQTRGLDTGLRMELEYSAQAGAAPVHDNPFTSVYLFDNETLEGKRLRDFDHYLDQVSHALHLALFSPLGDNQFSQEDNHVRRFLLEGGLAVYGGAAVAELVFPEAETIDYLAAKWASDDLSDLWLRADLEFERQLGVYESDLETGIRREKPTRANVFRGFLQSQAVSDDASPFMRRVFNQSRQVDDKGRATGTRAQAWFDRLTQWVEAQLPRDLVRVDRPDIDALRNRDSVEREIVRFELELEQRWEVVQRYPRDSAPGLIAEILTRSASSDGPLSRGEGRHRLLYWLFDDEGPLHPLAVRTVLYDAQELLGQKMRELVSGKQGLEQIEKSIRAYAAAYDDHRTEERVETAVERVRSGLQQPAWQRLLSNDLKAFVDEYMAGSENQAQRLSAYLKAALAADVLRRVKAGIDRFVAEWEALFGALRSEKDDLQARATEMERRHDEERNPTVQHVFAGVDAKRAMWDRLRRSSDRRVLLESHRSSFEVMYRRFVDPDSVTDDESPAQAYVNAMLSHMRGFIRDRGAGSVLPTDVVDALELEAAALGRPVEQHTRERIQSLQSLSRPFLQVSTGAAGSPFAFWGLNAGLSRKLAPLGEVFENRAQFEAAFSPFEIVRYVVEAGFRANQLARFLPADPRPGAGTVDGTYFTAFERTVEQLRRHRSSLKPGDQEPVSAHLDKRWDDLLPTFWDELMVQQVNRTLVHGLAIGAFAVAGGHWVWKGEPVAPFGAGGSLVGLRDFLLQRRSVMVEIERHHDEVRYAALNRHGTADHLHAFVRGFRRVDGADASVLALIADMVRGHAKRLTNDELYDAFRTACQEMQGYQRWVHGDVARATERAGAVLESCQETQLWTPQVTRQLAPVITMLQQIKRDPLTA